MIVKRLTAHMHSRSIHETDWDCGNCNGASCEYCNTRFHSYQFPDKEFDTPEEAQAYEHSCQAIRAALFEGAKDACHPEFFQKDGQLWVHFWQDRVEDLGGYVKRPCNPDAGEYAALLAEVQRLAALYDACPCKDKGAEYHISLCQMFGQCEEGSCRRKMLAGSTHYH